MSGLLTNEPIKVEVHTTEEDYYQFTKAYHFKRNLQNRVYWLVCLTILLASLREKGQLFVLSSFILKLFIAAAIVFTIAALIPYGVSVLRFRKSFRRKSLPEHLSFMVSDRGITITLEEKQVSWRWEALKEVNMVTDFIYFTLFNKQFFLIPKRFFSSDIEAVNFLGVMKTGILKVRGQNIKSTVKGQES